MQKSRKQLSRLVWWSCWLLSFNWWSFAQTPASAVAQANAKAVSGPAPPVQVQVRLIEIERRLTRELAELLPRQSWLTVTTTVSGPPPAKVAPVSRAANSVPLKLWLGQLDTGTAVLRGWQARGAWRELAAVRVLLQPGQMASYLAGGEFPLPTLQPLNAEQNTVRVVVRELGVKLDFKARVLDEKHLSLWLEPEIASPDFSAGLSVQGVAIPGVRLRRAKGAAELRADQSLVLAGLLESSEQTSLGRLQGLSAAPVLGELFSHRGFQQQETEMIILLTVTLLEPEAAAALPQLPGIREVKTSSSLPAPSLEGASGHAVLPGKKEGTAGLASGSESGKSAAPSAGQPPASPKALPKKITPPAPSKPKPPSS